MKKYILISIIAIFVFSCRTKQINSQNTFSVINFPKKEYFEINAYFYKLDSVNSLYLLSFKDSTSNYKIVSKKNTSCNNCNKLQLGDNYNIMVSRVNTGRQGEMSYLHVMSCARFDNTKVCTELNTYLYESTTICTKSICTN